MNPHQHRLVSMRQQYDSQDVNCQTYQSRRSSFSSSADSDIFSQTSDTSSASSQSSAPSSQPDFASQHWRKGECGLASTCNDNLGFEDAGNTLDGNCTDLPAQFSDLWTEVLRSGNHSSHISPSSAEYRSKIAPRRTSTVSPCARRTLFGRPSSLACSANAYPSSAGHENPSEYSAAPTPTSNSSPPNAPQLSDLSSPESLSSRSSTNSAASSCAPSVASTAITTPSSVASLSELSRTNSYSSDSGSARPFQRVSYPQAGPSVDRIAGIDPSSTHPRRTSLTQSWCKPSLTRQDERRQGFVEHLVDAATQLVAVIWPSSCSPATSPTAKDQGVYPLRLFIREVLRRSRASYSTLQVALYYIVKIKLAGKLPNCDFTKEQTYDSPSFRALQCGRRMFLASLILASKYLQDRNFSAKAWSKISGLGHVEISMNEMSFLDCIEWNLHIRYEEFQYWSNMVVACTDASQQGKRCPWRNVITCVMERRKRQQNGAEFSESRRSSRGDINDQSEVDKWASAFATNAKTPLQFEDSESWKRSLEDCFASKCKTEWPSQYCLAKADQRHQTTLKQMVLEPQPLIAPPSSQLDSLNKSSAPNSIQHSSTPAASACMPDLTPMIATSESSTPACSARTLPPLRQDKRGCHLKRLRHHQKDCHPTDSMQNSSCSTPSSAPRSAQPTPATSSAKDYRSFSLAVYPTPLETTSRTSRMPSRSHSQTDLQLFTRKLSMASPNGTSEVVDGFLAADTSAKAHRALLNPGVGVASTVGCRERLCSLADKKRRRATGEASETIPKLRRTNTFECRPSITPKAFAPQEIFA